ncbi:hypothetical protein Scep_002422 [Stephania cephalantha]|uniref:Polygalacturonase n=1 Tax=Stephania cephalantha TaxID=152367 RepID=A0AAP0Q8R8_9MAGN
MDFDKPVLFMTRPSIWAVFAIAITIVTVSVINTSTVSLFPTQRVVPGDSGSGAAKRSCAGFFRGGGAERAVTASIRDFGGIGDGRTSNTEAFRRALRDLERFGDKGGSRLNVPEGRWVTGSFNLTSNFTLFLERGAVILGSQNEEEWPVIEPLPSYGRGRERLGGRHISLIHGDFSRMFNVVIKGITILAPLNSPNTDGIDPDSSDHVCIEDCYIESGDDLVAVKSGWDQYGIKMARPSSNIIIRNVSGTTPTCSGLGIGSEMSGGVANIVVEDLHVFNSAAGVRIKTDKGRGGYIRNITITNITMDRVKVPIRFSRGSNDHPDEEWNPKAIPKVKGILISNVVSVDTGRAPLLEGIEDMPFEDICLNNITLLGLPSSVSWQCEFVLGASARVSPTPCPELRMNGSSPLCLFSQESRRLYSSIAS